MAILLANVVILSGEPQRIGLVGGRRIAWRVVRPLTSQQTGHGIIIGRIEEKRNRIPDAIGVAIDGVMRGRQKAVIGPTPQQVARIDQEHTLHHRGVESVAARCPPGQPDVPPELRGTYAAVCLRQQRNFLATLVLSQGVPMLCGGDGIGRTQQGNNNAYCQDNETSWFDWNLDDRARHLLAFTRRLLRLRQEHPEFRRRQFFQGRPLCAADMKDVSWLRPDGGEMTPEEWQQSTLRAVGFRLPDVHPGTGWDVLVDTASAGEAPHQQYTVGAHVSLAGRSLKPGTPWWRRRCRAPLPSAKSLSCRGALRSWATRNSSLPKIAICSASRSCTIGCASCSVAGWRRDWCLVMSPPGRMTTCARSATWPAPW
jgi:hypothetical protein